MYLNIYYWKIYLNTCLKYISKAFLTRRMLLLGRYIIWTVASHDYFPQNNISIIILTLVHLKNFDFFYIELLYTNSLSVDMPNVIVISNQLRVFKFVHFNFLRRTGEFLI